jgi:hypothetical protein
MCPKREGKEFAAHVLRAPFVAEKSNYYEEKAWNNASYVMHRMFHSFVIRTKHGLEQIAYSLNVESRKRKIKKLQQRSQGICEKSKYYTLATMINDHCKLEWTMI